MPELAALGGVNLSCLAEGLPARMGLCSEDFALEGTPGACILPHKSTVPSLCAEGEFDRRAGRQSPKEIAMQSRIVGTTMPVLEFLLQPNEIGRAHV